MVTLLPSRQLSQSYQSSQSCQLRGPPGPAGLQGSTGSAGFNGPTGPQGPTGSSLSSNSFDFGSLTQYQLIQQQFLNQSTSAGQLPSGSIDVITPQQLFIGVTPVIAVIPGNTGSPGHPGYVAAAAIVNDLNTYCLALFDDQLNLLAQTQALPTTYQPDVAGSAIDFSTFYVGDSLSLALTQTTTGLVITLCDGQAQNSYDEDFGLGIVISYCYVPQYGLTPSSYFTNYFANYPNDIKLQPDAFGSIAIDRNGQVVAIQTAHYFGSGQTQYKIGALLTTLEYFDQTSSNYSPGTPIGLVQPAYAFTSSGYNSTVNAAKIAVSSQGSQFYLSYVTAFQNDSPTFNFAAYSTTNASILTSGKTDYFGSVYFNINEDEPATALATVNSYDGAPGYDYFNPNVTLAQVLVFSIYQGPSVAPFSPGSLYNLRAIEVPVFPSNVNATAVPSSNPGLEVPAVLVNFQYQDLGSVTSDLIYYGSNRSTYNQLNYYVSTPAGFVLQQSLSVDGGPGVSQGGPVYLTAFNNLSQVVLSSVTYNPQGYQAGLISLVELVSIEQAGLTTESYLNFALPGSASGATASPQGDSGYGFRAVNGVIQFRNLGGVWRPLQQPQGQYIGPEAGFNTDAAGDAEAPQVNKPVGAALETKPTKDRQHRVHRDSMVLAVVTGDTGVAMLVAKGVLTISNLTIYSSATAQWQLVKVFSSVESKYFHGVLTAITESSLSLNLIHPVPDGQYYLGLRDEIRWW